VVRLDAQWSALWPALAFLLAGVPLAALLDRLGFFAAAADSLTGRSLECSVGELWLLAAVTTAVLNLDTTVVLLTPLYARIAVRARVEPMRLVVIPLVVASLASSVLPVSNLTTLIVVDRFHLGVFDVLTHIGLPSLVATWVGWRWYRRRHAVDLTFAETVAADRHALRVGALVVVGLLVGFVAGPTVGIDAWVVALVADAVLMVYLRMVPWRQVPVATAVGVAVIAGVVGWLVPATGSFGRTDLNPFALLGLTGLAAAAAGLVNNLPALLVVLPGGHHMTWGLWAWLLGVNVGAAILPIGALANLLWLRIVRTEGMTVRWRDFVVLTAPIVLPALAAAGAVLALESLVAKL
jgi:arsenical pump membrane protein